MLMPEVEHDESRLMQDCVIPWPLRHRCSFLCWDCLRGLVIDAVCRVYSWSER